MSPGLVFVSFQRGEGKKKKGSLFAKERFRHHAGDAIAGCSYLAIFSERSKNTSHMEGGDSWVFFITNSDVIMPR